MGSLFSSPICHPSHNCSWLPFWSLLLANASKTQGAPAQFSHAKPPGVPLIALMESVSVRLATARLEGLVLLAAAPKTQGAPVQFTHAKPPGVLLIASVESVSARLATARLEGLASAHK